ncbi:MAG: septum formation initiator family protein [Oscillospiraceae bacterium]|nr:septum formation initiator family protein [Oscillospiraceae bacterium]
MSESALKLRNERNRRNARNKKRSVARKMRKNKLGAIPMITLAIIIALLSVHLWNNKIAIDKKNEQIAALNQEYNHRRIKNDATQQKVDAPVDEEYIIDVAKDNGYRRSDEIIFYIN